MFAKKLCLAAMMVALLVGGLAGCRSRRKAAATPNASATRAYAQPAPTVTYPSSGPSQPVTSRTTPYPSTAVPSTAYPGTPYSGPTTTRSRVVVSRPSLPAPNYGGSPDGVVAAPTGSSYTPILNRPVARQPSGSSAIVGSAIVDSANTNAHLDSRISELHQKIQELSVAMEKPTPAVTAGEAQVQDYTGGADGRAAAFADQLRSRVKGQVTQSGNVVVVRLTDAFLSGSDRLKKNPQLVATLLTTADALQDAGAQEVLVVGHTDSDKIKKSKWRDNKHLSEARAQRVAAELSRRGVPASSLEVVGEGSSQPLVARERTKADKAKNRRVEVQVRF